MNLISLVQFFIMLSEVYIPYPIILILDCDYQMLKIKLNFCTYTNKTFLIIFTRFFLFLAVIKNQLLKRSMFSLTSFFISINKLII